MGHENCPAAPNKHPARKRNKATVITMALIITYALELHPNGKAEPQRRVCRTTTLNKTTHDSQKPRYNERR
jgi:hypothetical protein